MHYDRITRLGKLDLRTLEERFMEKVEKTETCWLWRATLNNLGYGQFGKDQRLYQAHRVAYELFVGEIPEGLELDHLCRVPSCVNPAHLEPVTHQENMRRANKRQPLNKTHCVNGHAMEGENVYIWRGSKTCMACRKAASARSKARLKTKEPSPGPLTHCKRGHEFTPENTLPNTGGYRTCRLCRRESMRQYVKTRKATVNA
jgi:hypothetical protein